MAIRAVFFDAGETLFDETRLWSAWADWLGVPRLTLLALLGAVLARGEHHAQVFELLRPGIDVERERAAREAAGNATGFEAVDLYPDARPCLETLGGAGFRIGIAGNYSPQSERTIREMELPVDVVGGSAGWGVEKPAPGFFARVLDASGVAPDELAYVGDRVDNDVGPATGAGMAAIHVRRGPWGYLQADGAAAAGARARIDSLAELPGVLSALV